ncbi:MAG: 2-amino-4-hydroxy-6-hydroxymethyldihydropteridine diphosphokinase [Haliea sp.]|nr:MAG: 2-amino-4-hydroxy-6-hydroxymethyldihydropteridine diphosphokinase [Haliea sp.]
MSSATPRAPVTACIALGANLGDAQRTVEAAIGDIDRLPRTRLAGRSSLYRSAPVDASGPDYINAVVAVRTRLSPDELLAALQALEAAAGRERPGRNAPRTLDLDILLYGEERIATGTLTVPHPRMYERAFVLVPLTEVAPTHVTAAQLAAVAGQDLHRL